MRPNVVIVQQNNTLGRTAASEDGIALLIATGVAVSPNFALNDVIGPLSSLEEAEALGIDADYDITNSCLVWNNIRDFYLEAGNGSKLFVMVVIDTTLMEDMCDDTNTTSGIKKALLARAGEIRLVGITRVPDGAYTPVYADQFEEDLWNAIDNLKVLRASEFDAFRPSQFLIEGRNWQGNTSSTLDLRDPDDGPNANRVSIVIGQDKDVADNTDNAQPKYAAVGRALGRAARIQVQRNIGRVKDGAVVDMTTAGLSNNANVNTFTDAEINTLNDKGYIFLLTHTQKAGFFFNNDYTACPDTDDYHRISLGRPADKASRIARIVYVEEILNDLEVDVETGKLNGGTCKHFEGLIEDEIQKQMTSQGELSGHKAFCDADQNVLLTDTVNIVLQLVPKGMVEQIIVNQSYERTISL